MAISTGNRALVRLSRPHAALRHAKPPHLRSGLCIARGYATDGKGRQLRSSGYPEPWSELRTGGKIVRSTQWTFNLAVILVGVALTGGVGYLMFTEVFSPHSPTTMFNRAVARVKSSEACTDVLGPAKSIVAFGASPISSHRRARVDRPATYENQYIDADTGIEHIKMRFLVQGSKSEGWVSLHMQWDKQDLEYKFQRLSLDVAGHRTIYLEGGHQGSQLIPSPSNFLGVDWNKEGKTRSPPSTFLGDIWKK